MKMKSLPPREILELKRESSSLFTDNVPLEPASDLQSDIDIETNGEHLVKQAKNSCPLTSHDIETESLEEHNENMLCNGCSNTWVCTFSYAKVWSNSFEIYFSLL